MLTPYYSEDRPCSFYSISEQRLGSISCRECSDFKRKMARSDEEHEVVEISVDTTLPSSQFVDIELFEKPLTKNHFAANKDITSWNAAIKGP